MFALYSTSSAISFESKSSLPPTTCHPAGSCHSPTPLDCAGMSLPFCCIGLFGFWAPGGSASHLICHFARFWACFAASLAMACDLHALYVALRSIRAMAASFILSLAALASSSAMPLFSDFLAVNLLFCTSLFGNSRNLEEVGQNLCMWRKASEHGNTGSHGCLHSSSTTWRNFFHNVKNLQHFYYTVEMLIMQML